MGTPGPRLANMQEMLSMGEGEQGNFGFFLQHNAFESDEQFVQEWCSDSKGGAIAIL